MPKYTLIASRDPFESRETDRLYELAADLGRAGNEVVLFLVQNGVLAARQGATTALSNLAGKQGVHVLADRFSLRERGIGDDALSRGVQAADLDVVVDHLAEGRKVVWH